MKCKNRFLLQVLSILLLALLVLSSSASHSSTYYLLKKSGCSTSNHHRLTEHASGPDSFRQHYHEFSHETLSRCYYTDKPDCPEGQEYVSVNENHLLCSSAPLAPANNNGDSGGNNTCNPINIATGNKFFTQQIYKGQGVDPLAFNLYYNSNASEHVWTSSYSQSLDITTSSITAKRPNGQTLIFTVSGGVITEESQRVERLIVNDDNIYELYLPNNSIERYRSNGSLLEIQYSSGVVHYIIRSSTGVFMWVTRNNKSTSTNESLYLTLIGGKPTRIVLPDDSEISSTWDWSFFYNLGKNNLIRRLQSITFADGSTRNFLYENTREHYITGILDENNNRISTVRYDSKGRAFSSEVGNLGSGIDRSYITYHDDGRRTVTNSLGKQNTYHFTQFNGEYKMTQVEGHASDNCAAANQAYTYDANGFMASKTDWNGNVTTYVHNDRGLEASRTEASGTADARTITTEWHPTFNLKTKITEPERKTVFTYDENGRLTSQEVSAR